MRQYNQYFIMVICWKRLFCGMHCLMISICDAESEFDDGTNERHLIALNIAITEKKEKQ